MATPDYMRRSGWTQKNPRFHELEAVLSTLNDLPLLRRLAAYRRTGRPGYSLRALWRAIVCLFVMNLQSVNALIRALGNDPKFSKFCGFKILPHRTTFNRFIKRLARHIDLVEAVLVNVTERVRALLPDLGQEVAIDSTTVRSHSNPNRKHISDPEASWTAKNSARAKQNGKEWHWGYKVHMVADANYGLPLAHLTTTAKRNDSPELPNIMRKAKRLLPWLSPRVAIADRGYDAQSNHQFLQENGTIPVIHIRKPSHIKLREGIYTTKGVPTCIGKVPMSYVSTDPDTGHHLYRCAGCHLAKSNRGGIRHCDTEVWEDPTRNIRLFGAIRRDGPEWKALYAKRQSIERTFKSLKESRRLERHCVRGLAQVALHSTMSVLTFQATALVRLQMGQADEMGWMVERVA